VPVAAFFTDEISWTGLGRVVTVVEVDVEEEVGGLVDAGGDVLVGVERPPVLATGLEVFGAPTRRGLCPLPSTAR
jgi:hypothetical protein